VTEVAFHFNAPDKLAYACRLLRKATSSGARLVVTGEAELLRRLDVALWTFSPLEFLPHCFSTSDAVMLAASPIVLAHEVQRTPHQQVLVNLSSSVPDGFERFERLIEVVEEGDEVDRLAARSRWKHYADRGYAITRHDLAAKGAN
jgi:DNA polymerase-3 subunit chi